MDRKIKHLEFLQGIVNRLSTNSFLLKGWSVLLISALFTVSTYNSNVAFVMLAYIPAIVFWGLDGYFLWMERTYRDMYDEVRQRDPEDIDFSLKIESGKIWSDLDNWMHAVLSKTLLPFHGVLIVAIIVVMFLIPKGTA